MEMKLTCPRCSAPIPASKIYIDDTNAHCTQCNFLFDFTSLVEEFHGDQLSSSKAKNIQLTSSEAKFFEQPKNGSLPCSECQANIPQKNINHFHTLAICSACDHLLDFSAQKYAFKMNKKKFPSEIPEEDGLEYFDLGNELFFKFRPSGRHYPAILLLVFFAVMGGVFILIQPSLFMILSVVIVELIFIYLLVGSMINFTIIHVDEHHIRVKDVPLNVGRNRKFPREDVFQLFVSIYPNQEAKSKKQFHSYVLSIINEMGVRKYLFMNFSEPDVPLFIENKVQQFWVMEDIPVDGELE